MSWCAGLVASTLREALLLSPSSVHATNYGARLLASCVSVTTIALVAVLLRLYVRLHLVKTVGPDDYTIFIAMTLSIFGVAFLIVEELNGFSNKSTQEEKISNIRNTSFYHFLTEPFYIWTLVTAKVSIALFLLRFGAGKFYSIFLWACIALLLLYGSFYFIMLLLSCEPLDALWDPDIHGTCFSPQMMLDLANTHSALSLATDVLFSLLPIPMLWNVQIKRRTKAGIVGIMSLGFLAAGACVVRLYYRNTCSQIQGFLVTSIKLTTWTAVECNVGILAASIPCLKPLFRSFFSKIRESLSMSRTH